MDTLGLLELPPHLPARRAAAFAARRLGGMSLLEWVVRRISECTTLDDVAVLAPSEQVVDELKRLAPAHVTVRAPDGDDPLERFVRAAQAYSATAAVRLRLDQPFLDPVLIDRLVTIAQSRGALDYAGFTSQQFGRTERTQGVAGEWCRVAALLEAHSLATTDLDRRYVTRFLCAHPRLFLLGWVPLPGELDREDVRLTLGGEDDWEHAHEIVEAVGGENLDWRALADLLKHQPALRGRMARLNRAEEAAAAAAAR